MTKLLIALTIASVAALTPNVAQATLFLSVGTTTITDNDANDSDNRPGIISYRGMADGFNIAVSTQTGTATSPSSLDLSNVLSQSSAPSTLVIRLTQTNITATPGFQQWSTQFSGNISAGTGTVRAQTYIDTTNTAFGTTTPLGDLSSNATAFGLASTNSGGGTTPYSLTEVLTVTANVAGSTFSLDTQLVPVPEPATLGLLGAGLVGLGVTRRRRFAN